MTTSCAASKRQSPASAGQLSATDRTTAAERVVGFLRKRHPVKTADCVSAETGINADTVQKWIDRCSMPSGLGLFVLVGVYGPDFLCSIFESPPVWLSRAASDERLKRIEDEIAALEAERAALAIQS